MCKHAASHITEGLQRFGLLPASHCKVSAKLCVEKCGWDGQGWARPGRPQGFRRETPLVRPLASVTVAILAQGTHWAVATSQAFLLQIVLVVGFMTGHACNP